MFERFKVEPIYDASRDIPTPEPLPKLHINSVFCGGAGS